MTYDALGRQLTQSNGVAKATYAYNPSILALDTETIEYDYNLDSTIDFTRVLDRSQDNLQRPAGFELMNGAAVEAQTSYTYHSTTGRLETVSNGTNSFTYAYLANSNLLESVIGPVHTVTNTWETTRNVLASKENKTGATVVSGYAYSVNPFGPRTNVVTTGTAFPATPAWAWGYNTRGEVVKADSSNDVFDRAYQFDGIGNRLKAADSLTLPGSNNYTPNVLNQYTAIASVAPVYDFDGNATAYPLPVNPGANSTLVWDAENRLISTTANGITTAYQYDSQSRRISKSTNGSTTVFVYDGWNPIAEYNGSALTKTYTWGLDLSGSMQSAGGVGGLLGVKTVSSTYFPTFDGNGNVSEYLDNAGAIAAHFEYDPFGREVLNTDSTGLFAHRFSTKPIDAETGLAYYGYRYYDPFTGRWPSRDPIEEDGGGNLYGFARNEGTDRVDLLGLWTRGIDWRGKRGKYSGEACAETGDTWESLSELILGKGIHVNKPVGTPSVPVPRSRYPVSHYLVELENRVRNATVEAALNFKAGFGGFPEGGWSFKSRVINTYFQGGDVSVECHSAAAIIMAKGALDVIGSADFDALYIGGYFTFVYGSGRMLEYSQAPNVAGMFEGDWGAIKGYDTYVVKEGAPWQGENIIKLDRGEDIWGHPFSRTTEAIVIAALEAGDNSPVKGRFIGFMPSHNKFTNISKLGMNVFDRRRIAK